MKYKPNSFNQGNEAPNIDVSSLIDVCFLLLIYFIITSTIAEQESDLMIQLPTPSGFSPEYIEPMQFHITKDGAISQIDPLSHAHQQLTQSGNTDFSHRTPEDMTRFSHHLKTYSQLAGENAMVVINTEPETPAQYVIDFLNTTSAYNIQKIVFKETL